MATHADGHHRSSAVWGSAGAISGPPQMKSLKEVNGRPPERKTP